MEPALTELGIAGYGPAQLIGRGGFATVYLAEDLNLGRHVAIKVLLASGVTEDQLRRFNRERRAIGTLSGHENILTVYDSGIAPDTSPYLITEYASGGSMQTRLDENGACPSSVATDIMIQVASGVQHAHENGVIHSDIKPANILFVSQDRPKLADFGIASIGAATATASISASLAYAAPEILNGEPGSVRSDVYGMGATLFSLLTAYPAFVSDTDASAVAIIRRVVEDPVPDLRTLGVPEDVAQVVERAMAKDPAERFDDAAAFAQALTGIDTNETKRIAPVGQVADPDVASAAQADSGGAPAAGQVTRANVAPVGQVTDPDVAPVVAPAAGKLSASKRRVGLGVAAAVLALGGMGAAAMVMNDGDGGDGGDRAQEEPEETSAADESESEGDSQSEDGNFGAGGAGDDDTESEAGSDTSPEDADDDVEAEPEAGTDTAPEEADDDAEPELGSEPEPETEPESESEAGPEPAPGAGVDELAVIPVATSFTEALPLPGGALVQDEEGRSVWFVDGSTYQTVEEFELPGAASDLAAVDGAYWAPLFEQDLLARIDALTGEVTSIDVGTFPIASTAGDGELWVSNFGNDTVSVIDTSSSEVIATIPVGTDPTKAVVGGGRVYVPNQAAGTVSVIDEKSKEVITTIDADGSTGDLFYSIDHLYVPNGNNLSVYDTTNYELVTNHSFIGPVVGVVEVDGRYFVTVAGAGSLVVAYDVESHNEAWLGKLNEIPMRPPLVHEGRVYIVLRFGELIVLDADTGDLVGQVMKVGSQPNTPVAGEGQVWITSVQSDQVHVFN